MSERLAEEARRPVGVRFSDDFSPKRLERPSGWRGIYSHPTFQVALLGFTCFMCPGMFNALTGLGLGGLSANATVQSNATSAVYATFAFFGFFSGTINNVLGPRLAFILGTLGYPLYISSYLVLKLHPNTDAYIITSGAVLGFCAALLWTAQGSLMMAYPTESQKGMYIGIFWAIFNLGGVVGSSVAFGENFHSQNNNVGTGTYIAFLILSSSGFFISHFIMNPEKVIRTDGTKVAKVRHPSWRAEFVSLFIALKTDPWVILLFPMFFVSNYFYTWQFNDYNGAIFTIRARALNNFIYWIAQIVGSIVIGYFVLDNRSFRRKVRAYFGWITVFVMVFVVHIWAYFYQKDYTRESETLPNAPKIDIYDSDFPAHIWLMIMYGILDSTWQSYAYWLMGAMSNDMAKLAVFTGFYKCLQSSGAAGVWRADGVGVPYMNIFLSTWALTVAGMIFALPMVHYRVKDFTDEHQDETLIHDTSMDKREPSPVLH